MIRHLAAIDSSRGLARTGKLPWRLPADVARYRRLAFAPGAITLMGRTTYDQVKDLLGDCRAYVLTHRTEPLLNATIITDLSGFLGDMTEDVWIIGGASIFEQTLSRTDELYLTEIEEDFGCDQFYPAYHELFELTEESAPQTENGSTYHFRNYRRSDLSE